MITDFAGTSHTDLAFTTGTMIRGTISISSSMTSSLLALHQPPASKTSLPFPSCILCVHPINCTLPLHYLLPLPNGNGCFMLLLISNYYDILSNFNSKTTVTQTVLGLGVNPGSNQVQSKNATKKNPKKTNKPPPQKKNHPVTQCTVITVVV